MNVEHRCPECGRRVFTPPGNPHNLRCNNRVHPPNEGPHVVQLQTYAGPDFGYVDAAGNTRSRTGHMTTPANRPTNIPAHNPDRAVLVDEDSIEVARARYFAAAGTQPDKRWGVERLRDEAAKAEADKQARIQAEAEERAAKRAAEEAAKANQPIDRPLEDLRVAYRRLTGEQPKHEWDAETLSEKIREGLLAGVNVAG